jgi:YggT family protein
MEGTMQVIFGFLAGLLGLYSLLIIIRIIITWFGGGQFGRPVQILASITDPYLDWWRQKFNLRAGYLDLSPIVAMAALSVAQTICTVISQTGRISLGLLLAVCLSALWSAVSFILGFCLIVLVLRLIAYMINANLFGPFWRVVDSISQPLLYRVNRIIFGRRMVRYTTGIIAAIIVLAALWLGGGIAIRIVSGLLSGFPL